jgi:hypothetical protein
MTFHLHFSCAAAAAISFSSSPSSFLRAKNIDARDDSCQNPEQNNVFNFSNGARYCKK